MFNVNSKKDRLSYVEVLRPPQGFQVSFVVGTTYSLDLNALIAVCLSLGLTDEIKMGSSQGLDFLAALSTLKDKMLIFCDAAQLKSCKNPSLWNMLLDKIVIPVALKEVKNGIFPAFHPKTWLIKYENSIGESCYRFVVLSRNLTFDRSWDICLTMDGYKVNSETLSRSKPISDFLKFLLKRNELKNYRLRVKLRNLSEEILQVSFSNKIQDFGMDFQVIPLGIGRNSYELSRNESIFSDSPTFNELVVISPFISMKCVERWYRYAECQEKSKIVLITRKSELSKISKILSDSEKFKVYHLKDEIVEEESEEIINTDIHAKLYLQCKNSVVNLYMGSMNATHFGQHQNVELLIRISTDSKKYNKKILLSEIFGDEDKNPFELCISYDENEQRDEDNGLKDIITELSRLPMSCECEAINNKYSVKLVVENLNEFKGQIFFKPFIKRRFKRLDESGVVYFDNLELSELSEFYVLRVNLGRNSIERVLKISTSGIPCEKEKDRDVAIISTILNDDISWLNFLSYSLGGRKLLSFSEKEDSLSFKKTGVNFNHLMPELYERLLKISLESPYKLMELADTITKLKPKTELQKQIHELIEAYSSAAESENQSDTTWRR